ncbi:MAG: glycosyltransferase family 4 protein [Alphaproteobacteria bacterium]|nr:glycosyltransferase family 4 protein [Alphaproteobacteria bacterium]
MHILFLTDNFPPEVNAPASRTFEHCREWVREGHQVTVITCAPNFPKGKVFDGYRNRLWQSEHVEGIRVIRVWSYITANEGFLRRTLDYVSYMASATLAAPFVRKVDIVVGTSPQFFTACAAWASAALKRIPFVFEVRDLWPDSIRAVGAVGSEPILNALEKLELFLYRRAAAVVTVTHAFKKNITQRGIEGDRISVVTNGVDASRFSWRDKDPDLVQALGLEGKFVAGYVGTHGMAHGLETLLDAAEALKAHPEGQNIHLLLLGDGAEKQKLLNAAEDRGLTNLTLLDTVPKDEVARYWSLLDVSIIHLRRTELFKTVIPSKLFECMAMGLPVLHGVEGESAEIVEINRIGLPFQPENSADLTHKLLKLHQNIDLRNQLRTNCLKAAPLYDRTRLAREMLATLGQCEELSAKDAGENANIERGRRAAEFHEGRAHH